MVARSLLIANTLPQIGQGSGEIFEVLNSRSPPKDYILHAFDLLLDDLNFRDGKHQELDSLTVADKWVVISQHMLEAFKRVSDPWNKNDMDEIEKLKGVATMADLECLEVLLRTRPISWLGLFIDKNGLNHLVNGLEQSRKEDKRTYEEMYIRCFKSLMNNKIGLEAVFEFKQYLNSITKSLWSPSRRTVVLVLEILGAVCLISGGRSHVLDSLECLSSDFNTRSRFDIVLRIIGKELLSPDLSAVDVLIACMSFINVMVSGGLDDNLHLRMYLRSEFEENGITKLIKKLSLVGNELLDRQIEVWDRSSVADSSFAFSGIHPKDIDKVKNIDDVLMEVKHVISKMACEAQLCKILRNLLIIQAHKRGKELSQLIALFADSVGSKPEVWLALNDSIDSAEGLSLVSGASVLKSNMELESMLYAERNKNTALEKKNVELSEEMNEMRVCMAQRATESANSRAAQGITKNYPPDANLAEPPSKATGIPLPPSVHRSGVPPPPSPVHSGGIPPPPIHSGGIPPPPIRSGGIPPPPPPTHSGGGPPPPPPPPTSFSLPPKRVPKSDMRLKPINWTRIPNNKAKTTVWSDIDDAEIHDKLAGSFYKVIDKAFQVVEVKPSPSAGAIKAPKKICLLDTRRSQNCSIMLKSVKMPLNEITAAISLGDVNKLSKDFLHDILKYIPTKEEVEMMKQNESEIENFAEPDRLLWELSKISYCRDKINAMILCKGFSESCNYIEDASKIVAQACEEIKNSSKLKEVLRIALALGNYLNSQSKDAVYGFKISSILKLSEVRALGSGRKTTLLHYFSELLNEQFPAIADFPNDMPHVPEAATVQFPQVTSVIETLKEGSAKTRQLIINLSSEVPSCASASETESVENENVLKTEDDSEFVKRISAFQAIAESHVITLESCFEAARRALRSISTYYAEDPNISPKEFFGVFASFFNMYRNAMADVLLSQEIEKKKNDRTKIPFLKRGQIAGLAKLKGDPNSKGSDRVSPSCADQNKGGNDSQQLEDLISSIRTGRAFHL